MGATVIVMIGSVDRVGTNVILGLAFLNSRSSTKKKPVWKKI